MSSSAGRAGATALSGPTGQLIDPRFPALDSIGKFRGVRRFLGRATRLGRSRFTSIAMCITYLIENGTTGDLSHVGIRHVLCGAAPDRTAPRSHERIVQSPADRTPAPADYPPADRCKLNGRSTGRIRVSPARSA
jgi:hypothetical protein